MSLQPVVIHFDVVYHHGEVDDATSKDDQQREIINGDLKQTRTRCYILLVNVVRQLAVE